MAVVKVRTRKMKSRPPLKSSFKKRKTKFRVKWSPDVREISRTVHSLPVSSKYAPKLTRLLVKLDDNKTDQILGKLYAKEDKNGTIRIQLHGRNHIVLAQMQFRPNDYKIESLQTDAMLMHLNRGESRVRMMWELGDVIWLTPNMRKMRRSANAKGYDLTWFEDIIETYRDVSVPKMRPRSLLPSRRPPKSSTRRKHVPKRSA